MHPKDMFGKRSVKVQGSESCTEESDPNPCYFTLDNLLAFHQLVTSKEIYDNALRKFVVPVTNGLSRTVFIRGDIESIGNKSSAKNACVFTGSGIYVDVAWEIFTEIKAKQSVVSTVSASIVEFHRETELVRDLLSESPDFSSCPNIVPCQDAGDLLCLLVTGQKNCSGLKLKQDKHVIFRLILAQ